MLQPQLISFLIEPDHSDKAVSLFPVLPVGKHEGICFGEEGAEDSDASPFPFVPQTFRLSKEDELFEDGDIQRHLYLQDAEADYASDVDRPKISEFKCHIAGCCQLFDSLEEYEHHYNSLHRNVCSHCKRSFPSAHLLDIHLSEWHDSLFQILSEKQLMYQCLVEGCAVKFKTYNDRKDHLIKVHSYPADFRFGKPNKSKSKNRGKTPVQREAPMELSEPDQAQTSELMILEPMETSTHETNIITSTTEKRTLQMEQNKPHYSYKVPTTICFGKGSVRGFHGRKKK
ncbi:zinc finger protein 511 [Erpetoichthys calabaricus]|uniref:Zinc finger protein 511 n=1 Tax=Erpetoichthys calabaricus TaxID=27687 RepID=A0A8C4XI77_ERPCA|nr:zinc finger protein 511 [Erpetoichthys calabaricus]